jgi:hypothetical protein
MTSRRNRDERGAAAVIFAITAVVLFGVGAFAVDIGQAFAKKSLEQTDVDVAVMAAAAKLTTSGACNPEVVATATDYLTKAENTVTGQYPIDLTGTPGDKDGYISCNNWRVDLWAPASRVDFALAGVLPSAPSGMDVNAHAAAQIKAARARAVMPFFAVQGCDYGQQSIRNDSGPSLPIPPLNPDSGGHNNIVFTVTPDTAPSGMSSFQVTLNGTDLTGVDKVGFTGAAGPPYHYEILRSQLVSATATSITVNVPTQVLLVDDVWYVRVFTNSGNKWSAAGNVQRFTVGPPKLYCDNSLEGNFGTIDIPRSDTNSFSLQWNMIKGVEPTLAIHPAPNGQCDGQPQSIESKTSPVNGTNCIATEPGLKIAETNEGMITGKGGLKGRLDADSTGNCSRYNNSQRTAATIKGYQLNDDLLTCFITNGASIQDLVNGTATANQALSSDIYSSPRFFWVPVLDTDPSTGKKSWPIVGFRPGFISDQSLTATHTAPGSISPLDGLSADSSGIREVKVILFNESALPEFAPTVGGEGDYTGSGPKALVLVE